MKDILSQFRWHSALGLDSILEGKKVFFASLPYTASVRALFVAATNDLLIHKTSKCLWRLTSDKKRIEPVFSNDILTEEEVKSIMEE